MNYSSIPKDPAMLLSFINLNLRDHYPSFQELCSALSLDPEQIKSTLKTIDYEYDEVQNQFI